MAASWRGRMAGAVGGQAGYARVYNVDGGVTRWAQAGQPLAPCGNC